MCSLKFMITFMWKIEVNERAPCNKWGRNTVAVSFVDISLAFNACFPHPRGNGYKRRKENERERYRPQSTENWQPSTRGRKIRIRNPSGSVRTAWWRGMSIPACRSSCLMSRFEGCTFATVASLVCTKGSLISSLVLFIAGPHTEPQTAGRWEARRAERSPDHWSFSGEPLHGSNKYFVA